MYFSKAMKAWQRSYKDGTSFLTNTVYRWACSKFSWLFTMEFIKRKYTFLRKR